MGVIKFLRDITGLFNWNADDNPTSEQTYMNAVKNWHETEKNLVDTLLWQPQTVYSVGNIVKTPSLPSQYCAECTGVQQQGESGAVEPNWSIHLESGEQFWDGDVLWRIKKISPEPITTYTSVSNPQSIDSGEWSDVDVIPIYKTGTTIFFVNVLFSTGTTETGYRAARVLMEYYENGNRQTKTYYLGSIAGYNASERLSSSRVIDAPYTYEDGSAYANIQVYQNCGSAKNVTTDTAVVYLSSIRPN